MVVGSVVINILIKSKNNACIDMKGKCKQWTKKPVVIANG